jgi:hypothetical protein
MAAGIQIKFTVTKETAAYLRWFARHILFEDGHDAAARHLMMKQLERTRRKYRRDESNPTDVLAAPSPVIDEPAEGE